MKTLPTLAFAAFVALTSWTNKTASAQIEVCTDLFISEYVEGTGNNKGFELYNPTPVPIDLNEYVLQRWSNGEAGMTDEVALLGEIAAYGTWVVINGQTEDVDLGGGATSPACDSVLQTMADQLDNPYPAPTYMNGDDALVLLRNGSQVVDIFGKPGEDPGVAWTNDAENGFIDIGDGATWLTSNHTLRRKFEVQAGVTIPPVAFDTFLEWDTLSVNTWDGLGLHLCTCNPADGIDKPTVMVPEVTIFPNPATSGVLSWETASSVTRVQLYTTAGQLVKDLSSDSGLRSVNVEGLPRTTYILNLYLARGTTISQHVVLQ